MHIVVETLSRIEDVRRHRTSPKRGLRQTDASQEKDGGDNLCRKLAHHLPGGGGVFEYIVWAA